MNISVVDILPSLDPVLIKKIKAACRSVKLTRNGYFRRRNGRQQDCCPDSDWRKFYHRTVKAYFPHAWVYQGGHHLAVHASAPRGPYFTRKSGVVDDNQAGQCLFRIVETSKESL